MNLYTFIQLEQNQSNPAENSSLFDILGDIPDKKRTCKLDKQQTRLMHTAIMDWYKNEPDCVTNNYCKQRDKVLSQIQLKDYNFVFSFHSGDDISYDCYASDTERLYNILIKAADNTNIGVHRFESI